MSTQVGPSITKSRSSQSSRSAAESLAEYVEDLRWSHCVAAGPGILRFSRSDGMHFIFKRFCYVRLNNDSVDRMNIELDISILKQILILLVCHGVQWRI